MKLFIKNIPVVLLMVLICGFQAAAQDATSGSTIIRGKITDKKTKEPIEGASVSQLDKESRIIKATTTDVEGNFVLRVTNPNDSISVTHIAFISMVEAIKNRTTINLALNGLSKEQDEVIVVSHKRSNNGLNSINERDLTTAIGKIDASALEEMSSPSIEQALQGRLSGVDITATSGDPGAAMNIRIRGVSSISSTGNPLIVVDGMPFRTEIPSDFNFGTADEQGYANLLNISPADIKDITVLKDAAATSVWGSEAANGVLIITTKRGKISKPRISYNFKGNTSFRPPAIPMLNGDQYSTLIPEAFMNRIGTTLNPITVQEFNYDPYNPYWYYNYSNNTNWVDAVTRQGYSHDHTISLTGGGEKARYYASVGYLNVLGPTIGTSLQRMNTRINLDYFISNKLSISSSIAYTYSDQSRNYMSNNEGAIRSVAYLKMPNMSVFEFDEYGNLTTNYFSPASNVQGQYSRIYNPVAMAAEAVYKVQENRIVPRFRLDYSFIKGVLNTTFDVQFDVRNLNNNSFLPQIATGRPNTETVVNRSYDGDIDGFNVTTKTSLNFTPRFDNLDHNFSAFFNFITNDGTSNTQEVMKSNTFSSLLVDVTSGGRTQNAELAAYSTVTQSRSVGAVVSAQYIYNDKYLFNASLRGDGNSRFGTAYRYGLFPGVSFRWRISNENFLKNNRKIDDLSFRASYAQSGRAPSRDYTFYNTYSTYAWSYQGQSAVFPSSMELKNLRWETLHGTNFGVNVSLFKGRIRSDIDIYRNRTKNLFFNGLQIASYTGYSSVNMNVGTMDNQGWEFALWTQPYKTKNLTIGFDFNISSNENIIRSISEFYPAQRGEMTKNGEYLRMLQVNNPFGSFYGYKFIGVYKDKESTIARDAKGNQIIGPNGQIVYMRFSYPTVDYVFQPGDAMYEDINKDGNIDYKDVVYLGNNNPKLTGGFGPSLSWKNTWRFTAFFSYRYDVDVVNGTKMTTTRMSGYDNQSTAVLRRWRNEGDVTDIPRGIINGGYNWLGSDKYVEDASFLRFRTVTVRYNFPPEKLRKSAVKTCSIFVTAENLFTFTKYTGQDPEVSVTSSDPFRMVVDNSMTPPTRNFTLGLSVGF